MSMIMYVARGSAAELRRLAESGGDSGTTPGLEALLTSRLASMPQLSPELMARMETFLQPQPQLAAVAPALMQRLREGVGAGAGTAPRGPATAPAAPTTARPETIDLHKS